MIGLEFPARHSLSWYVFPKSFELPGTNGSSLLKKRRRGKRDNDETGST